MLQHQMEPTAVRHEDMDAGDSLLINNLHGVG